MEVLTQLQHYSNVTEDGHSKLKSCFWHLYKSRKSYNRNFLASVESSFSADLLREDFTALSVVEISEPALQEEGDAGETSLTNAVEWRLVDIAKREEPKVEPTDNNATAGLRQRKQQKGTSTQQTAMQEEKEIIDPLNMFGGLTPTELKTAQKLAKEALQHYIEAANAVAKIQAQIAHIEKEKR
jgi:hypothetical protein